MGAADPTAAALRADTLAIAHTGATANDISAVRAHLYPGPLALLIEAVSAVVGVVASIVTSIVDAVRGDRS
jgi:hypothetical protein